MPNTAPVQTTLTSVPEFMEDRLTEIVRLIELYVPGLNVFKYTLPIGSEPGATTFQFPAAVVEPLNADEQLNTNAKYDIWQTVVIYIFVAGNNRGSMARQLLWANACLSKLFSNNALNDRTGANPSNNYLVNNNFWYDSKYGPTVFSPYMQYGRTTDEALAKGARAEFRFLDTLVH
jgi:hypothetical protein